MGLVICFFAFWGLGEKLEMIHFCPIHLQLVKTFLEDLWKEVLLHSPFFGVREPLVCCKGLPDLGSGRPATATSRSKEKEEIGEALNSSGGHLDSHINWFDDLVEQVFFCFVYAL